MSDTAQGPGWWQASDGKWYPPQAQPAQPSPAPAAPGPMPPAGYGYAPPSGAPPAGSGYAPPSGAPPAPPYTPGPGAAPYGYVPVPVDVLGRPLADWWQRLVAIIIDGLIFSVIDVILSAVVIRGSFGDQFSVSHDVIKLWLVGVVVNIAAIAYFAVLEGGPKGQSLGQMALGIAVRDVGTGGPITPQRAGLRMIILYPSMALRLIPVLGLILSLPAAIWTLVCGLSPLWNSGRQGYHDTSQKTTVIKVR